MSYKKNLVIVESPAKAKTISRFLGKDFEVVASMGHIRDLPKSDMGIDIEKNYKPTYKVTQEKTRVVNDLKKRVGPKTEVWIATDEDREGEAIGWHLLQALKIKENEAKRIVFHEITKGAILAAIENPRKINKDLVDAQQARRILDRLVGYELSPLLWKKVKYGLSAGRVQSVAVRLIVDREREIMAFRSEEYWKIVATLRQQGDKRNRSVKQNNEINDFQAYLFKYDGEKFASDNEMKTSKIVDDLKKQEFVVKSVTRKETKKTPPPPFTTSTLQMDAARKLGFSVKKTMMVAQRLYEGVDIGEKGLTGLITYMRTDSVSLSQVALTQAKVFIQKHYGKEYALDSPRFYKSKKGAQEAHEAIRPVDISITPDMIASFLDKDQHRLYSLVWMRTVACQMAAAIMDRVSVDIVAGKGLFRATGQTVRFPGFLSVYQEGRDAAESNEEHHDDDAERILPPLEEKENLDLRALVPSQHFTKPPARYTEASLVKKLEEEGIGRPSTYAPTISTIINRGYIEKEVRQLKPTDLAMLVTDLLTEHFNNIVDYQFTARMENDLDEIADGKKKWVPVIDEFYVPFHKNIQEKEVTLTKEQALKERILGKDKKSGLDVVVRYGRFGAFVQLGNFSKEEIAEMEEKPRRASLPKGAFFETITIEEALKALSIPKILGKNKAGEKIEVNIGRFGPYLKVGEKNVTLPENYDPYEITLAEAEKISTEAVKLKKKMEKPIQEFGPDPESGQPIFVKTGRFGPYVTDGKTNASISKRLGIEPEDLTFEQAVEILAKKRLAPKRTFGRRRK